MRALLPFALGSFALHGQPADTHPEFEVVSVKLTSPDVGPRQRVSMSGGPETSDPTRWTCSNLPLYTLVQQAYRLRNYQFTAPDWFTSVHVDITAKVPAGATREQFYQMQQRLLVQRFKLTYHRVDKEMQVYELVEAEGGHKLHESVIPSAVPGAPAAPAPALSAVSSPQKMDKDGYPIVAGGTGFALANGRGRLQFKKQSLELIALQLERFAGRPVIDATGIKGWYSYTLSFVPTEGVGVAPANFGGGEPIPIARTPEGGGGPTVFKAVQDQLGLKLVPKKSPVSVMVIDHAEKAPTEN